MDSLDDLTASITEKLISQGEWILSRDEVLELVNADICDVYGLIAGSSNPIVSFSTAEYSSQEPGVLVSLLECLGFRDAPLKFWKAGIWIPYEIQIELQEELLKQIVEARDGHKPAFDTFLDIFDHYSQFIRSLQVYTEEFFSRDEYIKTAVTNLLNKHPETNIAVAQLLLNNLAGELLRREIVPLWNLLVPLFTELKEYLIHMHRISEPDEEEHYDNWCRGTDENEVKINKARKLFGYGIKDIIDEIDLKKRYKEKMKKYHPDINPKGLELSKEINIAYALLLSLNSE